MTLRTNDCQPWVSQKFFGGPSRRKNIIHAKKWHPRRRSILEILASCTMMTTEKSESICLNRSPILKMLALSFSSINHQRSLQSPAWSNTTSIVGFLNRWNKGQGNHFGVQWDFAQWFLHVLLQHMRWASKNQSTEPTHLSQILAGTCCQRQKNKFIRVNYDRSYIQELSHQLINHHLIHRELFLITMSY